MLSTAGNRPHVASGSNQSRNMPFSEFWRLLGGRSDKLPQHPDIGYPNARNPSYSEECRVTGAALVISKGKPPFDPKVFLSKVNGGRAISDYRKDQVVYSQGEPADSVFYIRSGKIKKTVISEQGKEAVVALLGPGDFFGEGCLTGQVLRL